MKVFHKRKTNSFFRQVPSTLFRNSFPTWPSSSTASSPIAIGFSNASSSYLASPLPSAQRAKLLLSFFFSALCGTDGRLPSRSSLRYSILPFLRPRFTVVLSFGRCTSDNCSSRERIPDSISRMGRLVRCIFMPTRRNLRRLGQRSRLSKSFSTNNRLAWC